MVEYRFQSLNFHELANNSPLQIEMHNLIQNISSVELTWSVSTVVDNLSEDNFSYSMDVYINSVTVLLLNSFILCM